MTGYGEARFQNDQLSLSIELRAVNNRYFKVTLRSTEPFHLLEPEFEKVIRRTIRRGTILAHMRFEKKSAPQDFRTNPVALKSYLDQIRSAAKELALGDLGDHMLSQVLTLPGVVPDPGNLSLSLHEDWPIIEKVLIQAVEQLQNMRLEEGKAMAQELLSYRDSIKSHLEKIRGRIPQVSTTFRDRLFERVQNLLAELDVHLDRSDLIKEVSIFAERSDIAEEVVRLASHLDQFGDILQEKDSPGRKLEFLTQEMNRETNTIGSKASDVEISREVVEIKGTLEKIRELIQNVE
jgi:uncharacterized protein (TIGR00255 family)